MVFAELYGLIATATGWSFDTIGELTFFDVRDLMRYWTRYPPPHLALERLRRTVAAAVGMKEPARPGEFKGSSAEDLKQLQGMIK